MVQTKATKMTKKKHEIPPPIAEKGYHLEVYWPVKDKHCIKEQLYHATVVDVFPTKKFKRGSFYKYKIQFLDGDIQTTRLIHLNFKILGKGKEGLKKKRKHRDHNSTNEDTFKKKLKKLPSLDFVVAPMVGASELAFRLLCRRYGATLAYTPMMNSEKFAVDEAYRCEHFQTCPLDRPLVAHFSGNDPDTLLAAAKHVESACDAIDLNLGCPQRIAYSGHFGSYLLEDKDRPLLKRIIKNLSENLSIPVYVKIRLLDSLSDTINLCKDLTEAGAALIAIHARERVNLVGRTGPGARHGAAKLDQVAEIKKALPHVPIISNGNVQEWEDVVKNREFTNADGIMSAEGLLDNPALFSGSLSTQKENKKPELALEYLDLAEEYPVKMKSVIFHVRRICRDELTKFQMMEECLASTTISEVRAIVKQIIHYRETGSFKFDPMKEKRAKEAAKRKKQEESKRKQFEARMIRKAKRNGKASDFYLNQGAEIPTIEKVRKLKSMAKEEAFAVWKSDHSQHCYNFHFNESGCSRDRACAFLHADASMEAIAYG